MQFLAHQHGWARPPSGMRKCNVDALVFVEQNLYGHGMCIRDDFKRFIIAKSGLRKAFQHLQKLKQKPC